MIRGTLNSELRELRRRRDRPVWPRFRFTYEDDDSGAITRPSITCHTPCVRANSAASAVTNSLRIAIGKSGGSVKGYVASVSFTGFGYPVSQVPENIACDRRMLTSSSRPTDHFAFAILKPAFGGAFKREVFVDREPVRLRLRWHCSLPALYRGPLSL